MSTQNRVPRVLVVGGGYVGLYTAQRLLKKLQYDEAIITVVEPRSYMTYQPFLPEAAAGSLSPRHVVVPLRRVLEGAEIISGRVFMIDHERKVAQIEPLAGEDFELPFDYLVSALGSVVRTLPVPGLAEHGIGFKQVEEAIAMRNHVISQLDIADSTDDEEVRRKALTFVFVGGGFAGVEALAELEDMARYACRWYSNVKPEDMRWVLVEAASRILPEVGDEMGLYTLKQLRRRNIEVFLETRMESCVDKHVVLSNGIEMDSSTIVWTAGVKPNPVLANLGLPLGPKGHVKVNAELSVEGMPYAWAAGDCAQVPDLTKEGAFCAPNAQHAVRQAKRLADNVIAAIRGFEQKPYAHKNAGSVASLGLHKGVAHVYGIKMKGFPAWFMHRTYHMSRVPTFNRKVRVVADWTLALFFRREAVSLGAMHDPRGEFELVARPAELPAAIAPEPKG